MNAQQHKARIERFDFLALRDFSAPLDIADGFEESLHIAEEAPPPPPPPPTYTQADLDRERARAFEEGFQKGVAEGKTSAENEDTLLNQRLQQLFTKLGGDLAAAHQEFTDFFQTKHHELIGLALSVAHKVAGGALKENADKSVASLIEQTLPMLLRQQKITVFVHPDIKMPVETHVLRIALESGFEGKVLVGTQPDLDIADCRLEWQDGAVERSTGSLWKEILQVVEGKDDQKKQPPAQAEEGAAASEASYTMPEDVYNYINSHLDTLDASLTNPDHPKE
ncbi:MAG: FliH/SctL family protein [Rickettsiales bacterium]